MWDLIIVNPLVNVLIFIYHLVGGEFGVAIILFTLLVRLATYPLTLSQMKGTQAMQNLQKDKRYLDMQAKYKGDKEKLAQEQMKLYKELGVNPMASCLPTLIQFPIIIGLYQSITHALAATPMQLLDLMLRIYPAMQKIEGLIPLKSQFLWMDLAAPEKLELGFLPFGIPILAIIVVVTTYLQSKLMTPPSANPKDQGAQMANIMNIYMPFFMGWIALTLASGLALYFVASNLIGIAQYAAMGKLDWKQLHPSNWFKSPAAVRAGTDLAVKTKENKKA